MSPPSSRPHHPTGEGEDSNDLDQSVAIDKKEKKWDNRASDEVQFEAVVEAERRRASRA